MKKQAAFTVVFILLSHLMLAQVKKDTIGFRRDWFRDIVVLGCGKDKMRCLSTIIRPDAEAFHYLKKAKLNYKIAPFGFLAGLIAWNMFANAQPQKIERGVGIIGDLGVFGIFIAFHISGDHNELKAIRKYNSDVLKTSYNETKPQP